MAKRKFMIEEENIIDTTSVKSEPEKKSNVHPNSLDNLHPRKPGKKPKKYIQLDIYDHEDYLGRMAKYTGVTRTKYIQKIISNDMEAHKDEYERLKELSNYDPK